VRRLGFVITLIVSALAVPASASAAACPNFRVLHDDRIGPAVLPAGSYAVEPAAGSGLTCADASRLFTRFLEDWDGVLPRPWWVVARAPGNAGAQVGPLFFARGGYLLYLPPRSGIVCRRAAVLFTRFLAAPGGRLPAPWRARAQTATFFKPGNPTRSAFRVEPVGGAGPR
jgi:hypothetical protein